MKRAAFGEVLAYLTDEKLFAYMFVLTVALLYGRLNQNVFCLLFLDLGFLETLLS